MLGPFIVFFGLLCTVQSFPNGAPSSACGSMEPRHGTESQTDPSPYIISTNSTAVSSLGADEESALAIHGITVTIESPENVQFKGFFLQARSGDQAIGSFVVPKDGNGKLVNCNQLTQNAVTHSSKHRKVRESFVWVPPNDFQGQVVFTATVVQSTKTYWTNIKSSAVVVTLA